MAQSVSDIFLYLGLTISTPLGKERSEIDVKSIKKIIVTSISEPKTRLLSWKTFWFFVFYLPLPFYLFGIMTSFVPQLYVGIMEEFFEKNNPIDSLTVLCFTAMTYMLGPLQNVVVAAAFPAFPRNKGLRPPRNLTGLFFSYLGLILGSFLLTGSFYMATSPSLPSFSYPGLLGGFVVPSLGFVLSFTPYCWCTFIVCCWLTEFIGKCHFEGCPVTNTEQLLGRYKELDKSLGLYFAFTFTSAQLNWISQLYMGVISLNSPYSQLVRALFTGGSFLAASGGKNL